MLGKDMTYYRPPFDILGGRVPPVPRGIYAPDSRLVSFDANMMTSKRWQ